jgi:hypothetical protein
MGLLEKEIRTKDKRKNIQKILLSSIYTTGLLGLAITAPNVLSAIGKLVGEKSRKKKLKYSINESIYRLKEKGLIKIVEINGKRIAHITLKGESKLDFFEKHDFKLKIPKKWDGRWRVIIFDIKESKKGIREKLRLTLSQIGFIKLQNSVWIYPYDCEDLISLLKTDFMIGEEVLYMIVEKLENDFLVKKIFKLPNSSGRRS